MSSPRPSPTKPLTTRDVNTSSPTKPSLTQQSEKDQPKSMEYHRQVLQSRLEEDKSGQKYISPSDAVMSPCTAKLSAYKSKHFMKAKPQSLFAKMEASKKANDAGKAEGEKEGTNGP